MCINETITTVLGSGLPRRMGTHSLMVAPEGRGLRRRRVEEKKY